MKKKLQKSFVIIIFILAISFVVNNVAILDIIKLPKKVFGSIEDLEFLNNNKEFGKFISIDYNDNIPTSNSNNILAEFKLFNLFTIKKINVNFDKTELYVPGNAIGFTLNSKGLIVLGNNSIMTEKGKINPLSNNEIQKGDIILSIGNEEINNVNDMTKILNKKENIGKTLEIKGIRDNKEFISYVTPVEDLYSKDYKLGIWIKNSANGVGTLTYIKKDDLRFGALGHPITDSDTQTIFNVKDGMVYPCNIIGVTKGLKGHPGELRGLFLQGSNIYGYVDKNNNFGVYGHILNNSKLLNSQVLNAGGRFSARPGKAKIRACIDGTTSKDYDIEIIKTNYQSSSNDKSMVIKVVDKELLRKTGGIVQGMSGSPIIQNGKVIGAVTHVFVNDPTKGFGIYLDWMLNE